MLSVGDEPLGGQADPCERFAVPKVDPPASSVMEFRLTEDFQADFDAWKATVEAEHRGALEITHEEVIKNEGVGFPTLLIFWRVVPRRTLSRGR